MAMRRARMTRMAMRRMRKSRARMMTVGWVNVPIIRMTTLSRNFIFGLVRRSFLIICILRTGSISGHSTQEWTLAIGWHIIRTFWWSVSWCVCILAGFTRIPIPIPIPIRIHICSAEYVFFDLSFHVLQPLTERLYVTFNRIHNVMYQPISGFHNLRVLDKEFLELVDKRLELLS